MAAGIYEALGQRVPNSVQAVVEMKELPGTGKIPEHLKEKR